MNLSKYKNSVVNGCECWDFGPYRIVKQRDKDIYNAYRAVEPEKPRKPDEPISQYCSVEKIILRVETHTDDNGEEVKTNVMGAKEYKTLESAMADCEKDAKVK